MYTVTPAFFQQLKHLEAKKNRNYTWQEIGDKMGISRQAAQSLFSTEVSERSSTQYRTLASLLDFFRSEGLDIDVGDLFSVERTDGGDE